MQTWCGKLVLWHPLNQIKEDMYGLQDLSIGIWYADMALRKLKNKKYENKSRVIIL